MRVYARPNGVSLCSFAVGYASWAASDFSRDYDRSAIDSPIDRRELTSADSRTRLPPRHVRGTLNSGHEGEGIPAMCSEKFAD